MQSFSEAAFKESGVGERREVLLGSASDSIGKLAARGVRFDIAFLDADKTGYLVRLLRVFCATAWRPEHSTADGVSTRLSASCMCIPLPSCSNVR